LCATSVWLLKFLKDHQCSFLLLLKKGLCDHSDWFEVKKFRLFPFLGLESYGVVSRSSNKSLQGRKNASPSNMPSQCLGTPCPLTLEKWFVSYADHADWVIKTYHLQTRQSYYSPLLLIESELRFHTAKSSDLFCLLESQSLNGLRFGKCKFTSF
jgi:hypothetical protein